MTDPNIAQDEVLNLLTEEGCRILPGLTKKVVDPWAEKTASEILSGRALSAGPTRGGGQVQIRFRLGARLAASSHRLSLIRDHVSMEFFSPDVVASRMHREVTRSVIRTNDLEDHLGKTIRDQLEKFAESVPQEVVRRSRPNPRSYAGDIHRMSYDLIRDLKIVERVLSAAVGIPGDVPRAMEALVVRAAELAVSVPHHLFSDSGRKLEHETAKRKLLKAMKVALLAGVTDQELEDIKNEALVNQIMTDV